MRSNYNPNHTSPRRHTHPPRSRQVHERSLQSDFLLIILREVVRSRPDLRIVLMSATINATLFSNYFATAAAPPPSLPISQGGDARGLAFAGSDALDALQHGVTPPERPQPKL